MDWVAVKSSWVIKLVGWLVGRLVGVVRCGAVWCGTVELSWESMTDKLDRKKGGRGGKELRGCRNGRGMKDERCWQEKERNSMKRMRSVVVERRG